jgi:hypothetical protein
MEVTEGASSVWADTADTVATVATAVGVEGITGALEAVRVTVRVTARPVVLVSVEASADLAH